MQEQKIEQPPYYEQIKADYKRALELIEEIKTGAENGEKIFTEA